MSFTILQTGSTLQMMDDSGNLTTLTLPTGVTLDTNVPPRWQTYGNYVDLVNTPNTPLTIDATGTVRVMVPTAPTTAPILSAGLAGTLSGTYQVRCTFIVKDAAGTVIAESDFSPISNSFTIVNSNLRASSIPTSSDAITARRLYRTTTNGAVFFPWLDVDGNVITQIEDDLSDAGLSIIAAPTLGNPPRLTHLKEWRNRLWGVALSDSDTVRFAQADTWWAWPATNTIPIPGRGRDKFGIKALMPRREALGIGRRDLIWQVTGQTPTDFRAVKLSEIMGVESQESVVLYRDTAWWLWKDGVYQWDSDGLRNVSDGQVKSWFSTTSYFNQNMFQFSFAVFDPNRLKYKLYLASAGSNVVDRWVEYDIQSKTWWGPHKTGAFSPTSAFLISDASDKVRAVAGSGSGFVWQETTTPTDNINTGIDFNVVTKFFDDNLPDYEKVWEELFMLGKVQAAGTMSITPKVGYLDATAQTPITYDMTQGRQRLPRVGTGKLMQLTFNHTAAGESVELYGFDIITTIIGHR